MKSKNIKQTNSSRRKFLQAASIGSVTAGSFLPTSSLGQAKGSPSQSNKPNIVFISLKHSITFFFLASVSLILMFFISFIFILKSILLITSSNPLF